MTQDELRSQLVRLQDHATIEDCQELISVHADFMMLAIKNHHSENLISDYEGHGKLVLQMVMTKAIAVKTLLDGLTFVARDGSRLNKLLDPVIF